MFRLVLPLIALVVVASARSLQGRIVGGQNATIEDYPYQVSLEFLYSHRCGGSLLKTNIVVTAAHCVDGLDEHIKYFRIRAGTNLSNSKYGQTAAVTQVHQHPKFTESLDYDIAILVLQTNLLPNDKVQVISLVPPEIELGDGEIADATGWGALRQNGRSSKILQSVEVPRINYDLCSEIYTTLTDRMICYGYSDGGKDACQGDSGGPLVHTINEAVYLVGVVSWGHGCGQKGLPGVYTDIANVEIYEYVSEFLN